MEQLVLQVKGMHCTGCEKAIRAAVGRLEGVRRVGADHRCEQVTVAFDPSKTSEASTHERIDRAGYEVES